MGCCCSGSSKLCRNQCGNKKLIHHQYCNNCYITMHLLQPNHNHATQHTRDELLPPPYTSIEQSEVINRVTAGDATAIHVPPVKTI